MSVHILKDVTIVPDILTVGDLVTQARDGKIAVMPEWLQRLMQSKAWRAKKGEKAKSYLYSFFNGNSLITPFYLVKIEILSNFIQQEREWEKNKVVKEIYNDIMKDLEAKVSSGVKYILLDGQNRLYEALIPFFDGKLLSNDYVQPFVLDVDGKEVLLNNFRYTDIDLDPRVKDAFFNTQIVVAEGTAGNIHAYVNSVIAMNNGVSWTKFESAIIRMTPLTYLINRDSFHEPVIQNLFGNHALSGNVSKMTGVYEIAKKGDARFIAELVYLIGNECNSGICTEDGCSSMLISSDEKFVDAYHRVRNYLFYISKHLNCLQNKTLKDEEKPLSKESLRGLVLLLDMMTNKSNAYSNHVTLKVRSLDLIRTPQAIMEEFIVWHNEMTDQHANPNDFKNGDPIPDTYVHNTRGVSKDNMYERMQHINSKFLSVRGKDWIAKSYIASESADYKSLETAIKKQSDYTDPYSKANPKLNLRSKVHIDHVKPRSKGGTDAIENLVVTNPKSNLLKSDRY